MNCRKYQELIATAARAGEVSGAADHHLARCAACREFAEQMTVVAAALANWEEPALGTLETAARAAVVERLAAAQHAAPASGSRLASFRRCPPLITAARALAPAILVLAILGLTLFQWRHPRGGNHPWEAGYESTGGHSIAEQTIPRVPGTPSYRIAAHAGGETRAQVPDPGFTPARGPRAARRSALTPTPEKRQEGDDGHRGVRQAASSLVLPPRPFRDDLSVLNGNPIREASGWAPLPQDERAALETRVRRGVPVKEEFVQIPFPRLATASDRQVVAAEENYRREAAIVDARLARAVTLRQKATALSDLCDRLRAETGISLRSGRSVADEKVTIFCEKLPLRQVMRQLSRPFGYTWLRSGTEGEYRYELVQDLRSQLTEEELRNRDRNAALLDLDREMNQYRPYLGLPPDEVRRRAKEGPPAERKLPEHLGGTGWGPLQLYFRLAPSDLAGLRAGQSLTFSADPKPGELPLPPDLVRGVLQSVPDRRILKRGDQFEVGPVTSLPGGLPPASVPEAIAIVTLRLDRSELGQLTLAGGSGFSVGTPPHNWQLIGDDGPVAVGVSPAVRKPENAVLNAKLARDPGLQPRVSVLPKSSCNLSAERKVTSADVLEALHQATGLPVVSDFYTHLYKPEAVSVQNQPLFDALNQLAETLRLRWHKEAGTRGAGEWLQFRSASFFNDRLKEVPNRLLARWSASRRQHGTLTLDELVEIAQLSDAQLDSNPVAEAAKECFGLAEWDLARNGFLRPNWRFLAGLMPAQRQWAQRPEGLPFRQMSLAQQEQFLSLAVPAGSDVANIGIQELTGAALRVDYRVPGWFQWKMPEQPGEPMWRVLQRSPVRERTRDAALQAARRIDPQASEAQLAPTQLELTMIYALGGPNARLTPLVIHADLHNTLASPPALPAP